MRKRLCLGLLCVALASFVAATTHAAEISNFDASEGLNLDGEIVYAVNIGADFGDEEIDFGGVTFTSDLETDGFELDSTHEIRDGSWASPDVGDGDLDLIMSTIRWSNHVEQPAGVEIEMDATSGETYELQMLFYEACCNRAFDIFVDDELIVEDFAIHENHLDWDGVSNWGIQSGRQDGVLITETVVAQSDSIFLVLGGPGTAPDYPDNNGHISALILSKAGGLALQAGDADQDLDFDQLDLVKVQIGGKYLSGAAATWGEGDWNGAPGGSVGSPPAGDGLFDQVDIIAALSGGKYLMGKYGALSGANGVAGDAQTSLIYDAGTGELSVDAPAGVELTSINIDSAGSIFTGEAAQNLGGSFDNDADNNIFKATFGGSFGSLSFGNVAQAGLSADAVVADLTAVGSLAGGGDLGNVDLIYVPEPSSIVLVLLGLIALTARLRR